MSRELSPLFSEQSPPKALEPTVTRMQYWQLSPTPASRLRIGSRILYRQ
jgi:hypothetical protein